MTKKRLTWFLGCFLILLVDFAFGQKVKYKDIYGLLSTKQYEQAEPFLKRYLKNTDDNPNAYLFMGIIFQEKSAKMDVLKQTTDAMVYADSAILHLENAHKLIDDREIRKNKEYYESYNRRDLRTGEFGVKLSDIQFDIEKRIQALKERKDQVKMVRFYFTQTDSLYSQANRLYRKIQSAYPSHRQMYLRADAPLVSDLKKLSTRFDSTLRAFENYKSSSGHLGRTGYNQSVSLKDISDLKTDGASRADLYKDAVEWWNYKKFAEDSRTIIEKDIIPMRTHLVSYDIEINKLREKLNADSVSVRSDLTKLIDVLLYEQLKKYDPEPLPMQLFSMKTADLEYKSVVLENRKLKDSADYPLQLRLLANESIPLRRLDSISHQLAESNLEEKSKDYAQFISDTYSNTIVLGSYVRALNDFAKRERRKHTEKLASLKDALQWIVDGTDSIPLTDSVRSTRFTRLFSEDEKFTIGLKHVDSLTTEGYLYQIASSRRPVFKAIFPLEKNAFKSSATSSVKSLHYADATGQFYIVAIISQQITNGSFPVTVSKIYRADGVAWTNHYTLGFIPKELLFRPDTADVVLSDGVNAFVLDKAGKVIK